MTHYLNEMLIGSISLLVCTCLGCDDKITLQQRRLPQPNPTTYEFDAGIGEVKVAIKRACGDEWGRELRNKNKGIVWKGSGSADFQQTVSRILQHTRPRLYWKEYADPIITKLLSEPGNENDAFIDNNDAPVESRVYYKNGITGIYQANYRLHLAAINPRKTRVEVITYDSRVGVGEYDSPAHGSILLRVSVEPTTIEEYEILLRIGKELGVKDMLPLVIPGPDAPIKILKLPRKS